MTAPDRIETIDQKRHRMYMIDMERDNKKKGHVEAKPPTVIEWGHAVAVTDLPLKVQGYVAPIADRIEAKASVTYVEGAVFKTGKRIGEKRPDKRIEHCSIALRGKHPLTAVWSDGKLEYAKHYDGEYKWTTSVRELQRWIKNL